MKGSRITAYIAAAFAVAAFTGFLQGYIHMIFLTAFAAIVSFILFSRKTYLK